MPIDFAATIAAELNIRPSQAAHSIELFDDDNTVPFVARYRKEATGGLDEVQLWTISERLSYLRNLEARKTAVLKSIDEQGKLTDELRTRLEASITLQAVEDLYLPYRPKRRTRATLARERGLEPLALIMLAQKLTAGDPDKIAAPFLSEAAPTIEDAYAGARDIIAEIVAEDADIRTRIRNRTRDASFITVSADESKDERGVYRMYYEYRERLSTLPPHRLLAINRGEREGVLKARLERPDAELLRSIEAGAVSNPRCIFADQLRQAAADGYERLLAPSIERELRGEMTTRADEHAIRTFAANLRQLLLQPPIRGRAVIGIDPGFRTGCKVAVVDATGKFLGGGPIYPHEPRNEWASAKASLLDWIARTGATVIAIGNGTASRESEALAAEVILDARHSGRDVVYVMVSEAGASVYSASEVARAEFPDLDLTMRGAISIARRLQDPLAELVKIEPKAIGVGLYQHDVDQKRLGETLDTVVESAVNHVGVDVNTASASLLSYVAGIKRRVAEAIVRHRDEGGPFRRREELKQVKGLGDKTYQQAIGFLRIPGGDRLLDNTFIHPESYPAVERLFAHLKVRGDEKDLPTRIEALRHQNVTALAATLEVGEPTLLDILEGLARPGRDPREEMPAPLLRQDVLKMEDLKEGMVLMGTVRNVVDFGAFVDIGVKQDGLVHVSQMEERYVKNPFAVVSVGDVVKVKVTGIDLARGRIALSMKGVV
jgi:protein Tex